MTGSGLGQSALRVQIVRDLPGLKALERDWQRLWDQDQDSDIFASYDWFMNWWEHFGRGGCAATLASHDGPERAAFSSGAWQLRVFVVRDEDDTAFAILPLVLKFKSAWRRILATPVNDHAPRAGLIASQFGEDIVSALCWALTSTNEWDVLFLYGLPAKTNQLMQLVSGLRQRGLPSGPCDTWSHGYLRFQGTWEDFLKTKGRHFRKNLGQPERALEKLGELSLEKFAGSNAATRGLELFLTIDRASWKAREGESVGRDAALRDYYSDLCGSFGARGRAEVWVLRVGGEAAAAYLCLYDGRSRYTLKTSFSEVFGSSRRSPSHVLLGRIIRESWGTAAQGIDFVGKMQFVERWATEQRLFVSSVFYRSRLVHARFRARELLAGIASRIRARVQNR